MNRKQKGHTEVNIGVVPTEKKRKISKFRFLRLLTNVLIFDFKLLVRDDWQTGLEFADGIESWTRRDLRML